MKLSDYVRWLRMKSYEVVGKSKNGSIMKKNCINRQSQQIRVAAKRVVESRESACLFLKSAGIMTPKGNLSPKFK